MKSLVYLLLSFVIIYGYSCDSTTNPDVNPSEAFSTIAFGSCNKQDLEQPLWASILENEPDLWIWLGDNIYGDSYDMEVIKAKYEQQLSNGGYQNLKGTTPIVGIWDDHDYGVNDGDKRYQMKAESKILMLNFLDVDENAAVRQREGAFQSYTFGEDNKKVKVFLLDARYFRDELKPNPVQGGQRYLPNDTGTVLGEIQWQWLESELTNSDAELHIIGCGIQMIAEDHIFEKWANFPNERQRLFDLLKSTQVKNTILISGDRHIAEISKIELDGLDYPLYDITSSGLTHSYEQIRQVGETNQHRVGDKYTGEKNFGVFTIDWSANPLSVKAQIRGLENKLIFEETIQF